MTMSESVIGDRAAVSVSEAARLLSVSRSHLYACIASGLVPSVRIGNAIRVPASYLRSMMEAQA